MTRAPRSILVLLWMLTGPIVWAGHFFAIYLAEALICAVAPSQIAMRVTTLLLTGAALAIIGGIVSTEPLRRLARLGAAEDGDIFLPFVTVVLAALSALAIVWAAIPALTLPVCAAVPG